MFSEIIFNYLGCTDADNGKTDTYGEGCDYYWTAVEDCAGTDRNGFSANAMCCACGGGATRERPMN